MNRLARRMQFNTKRGHLRYLQTQLTKVRRELNGIDDKKAILLGRKSGLLVEIAALENSKPNDADPED